MVVMAVYSESLDNESCAVNEIQAGAGAMAADKKTRVLRTPPPSRVSASKSYVWVSAQQ